MDNLFKCKPLNLSSCYLNSIASKCVFLAAMVLVIRAIFIPPFSSFGGSKEGNDNSVKMAGIDWIQCKMHCRPYPPTQNALSIKSTTIVFEYEHQIPKTKAMFQTTSRTRIGFEYAHPSPENDLPPPSSSSSSSDLPPPQSPRKIRWSPENRRLG